MLDDGARIPMDDDPDEDLHAVQTLMDYFGLNHLADKRDLLGYVAKARRWKTGSSVTPQTPYLGRTSTDDGYIHVGRAFASVFDSEDEAHAVAGQLSHELGVMEWDIEEVGAR